MTVAQGKVVWYKLYNGNAVPVMVSFYFSFISFHDVTITIALNRQYHLVLADCFL